MKNSHRQEKVNINGEIVDIDSELVPLIRELNKAGLTTTQCCQGGKYTLADDMEADYPAHIVFKSGPNTTFKIKPLGPNNEQQLVIEWKKTGSIFA